MARGKLEPPKLDDRTWQQLVDQAKALIPAYAPEWTDHNPSDLGITLIELFAWMTEQLIYRLNRVPEKTYTHLLNLVGIRRRPAVPARVVLAFQPNGKTAVELKKGDQFATPQTESQEAVVFELDESLVVIPESPIVLWIKPDTNNAAPLTCEEITEKVILTPDKLPEGLKLDLAKNQEGKFKGILAIGFPTADPLPSVGIGIHLAASPTASQWTLRFSYSKLTEGEWTPLGQDVVFDGTDELRHDGRIRIVTPSDWPKQKPSNWTMPKSLDPIEARWIGLEITAEQEKQLDLKYLFANAALATNALMTTETLGKSTGKASQVYELSRALFVDATAKDAFEHLVVETIAQTADAPETITRWVRVEDLSSGGLHEYWLEETTGSLHFGDFQDEGRTPHSHGLIPPEGQTIRATYRYVAGGVRGKVPARSITEPRTPGRAVKAINPGPAFDGKDEESVEDAKQRGPEALRTRDRAVTIRDVEYLARDALPNIAKVRCLPPRLYTAEDDQASLIPVEEGANGQGIGKPWRYGGMVRDRGRINVIIVPEVESDRPAPSTAQKDRVRRSIVARSPLTVDVEVHGPRYVAVNVVLTGKIWDSSIKSGTISEVGLENGLEDLIRQFLHPLRGGKQGTGWEIGEDLFVPDLLEHLRHRIPPSIGYITGVTATGTRNYQTKPQSEQPPPNGEPLADRGRPLEVTKSAGEEKAYRVAIADYELICGGESIDADLVVI